MSIVLAATWDPRGELSRLERLMPLLHELYKAIVIVVRDTGDVMIAERLTEAGVHRVVSARAWAMGRVFALEEAVTFDVTHLHYADLDRLIRWAETRPDELRSTLLMLETVDVLMIGRTQQAMKTHPEALQESEKLLNRTFAWLFGSYFDLPAGSKGFSRAAAQVLYDRRSMYDGLISDSVWPVLLHHAGFKLTPLLVDGLDWETADRYRDRAATSAEQGEAAAIYDADPGHWKYRLQLANTIAFMGLSVWHNPRGAMESEEPS